MLGQHRIAGHRLRRRFGQFQSGAELLPQSRIGGLDRPRRLLLVEAQRRPDQEQAHQGRGGQHRQRQRGNADARRHDHQAVNAGGQPGNAGHGQQRQDGGLRGMEPALESDQMAKMMEQRIFHGLRFLCARAASMTTKRSRDKASQCQNSSGREAPAGAIGGESVGGSA